MKSRSKRVLNTLAALTACLLAISAAQERVGEKTVARNDSVEVGHESFVGEVDRGGAVGRNVAGVPLAGRFAPTAVFAPCDIDGLRPSRSAFMYLCPLRGAINGSRHLGVEGSDSRQRENR